MRFLKSWFLCDFLTRWIPCHEPLFSLLPRPTPPVLFEREGVVSDDGMSIERTWEYLLRRWRTIGYCLKLFLVLLMIYSSFAEIRTITSSSMFPTLNAGDRVIAEKVSYYLRRPSVGDIVLFRVSSALQDLGFKRDEIFVKRIIAKAGDSIEVHHGSLFVNGIARKEDFIAEQPKYRMRVTHVPAGHVYVMGDNRNNSFDSHAWGPLPIANVVGRCVMRFSGVLSSVV